MSKFRIFYSGIDDHHETVTAAAVPLSHYCMNDCHDKANLSVLNTGAISQQWLVHGRNHLTLAVLRTEL